VLVTVGVWGDEEGGNNLAVVTLGERIRIFICWILMLDMKILWNLNGN